MKACVCQHATQTLLNKTLIPFQQLQCTAKDLRYNTQGAVCKCLAICIAKNWGPRANCPFCPPPPLLGGPGSMTLCTNPVHFHEEHALFCVHGTSVVYVTLCVTLPQGYFPAVELNSNKRSEHLMVSILCAASFVVSLVYNSMLGITHWGFSSWRSPTKGFDTPDFSAAHCCLHQWYMCVCYICVKITANGE